MVLVGRVVRGGRDIREPLADLACALVIPGALMVDGARAGAGAAAKAWGWLRRKAGCVLRAMADVIDPRSAPVPCYELGSDPERVQAPDPIILPMPEPMLSAAQVTAARAPRKRVPLPAHQAEAIRRAIAEHGSIRAAARALGIPESTLRSRAKAAGIELPTRRGKPRQK
jgi:hypothetical protein